MIYPHEYSLFNYWVFALTFFAVALFLRLWLEEITESGSDNGCLFFVVTPILLGMAIGIAELSDWMLHRKLSTSVRVSFFYLFYIPLVIGIVKSIFGIARTRLNALSEAVSKTTLDKLEKRKSTKKRNRLKRRSRTVQSASLRIQDSPREERNEKLFEYSAQGNSEDKKTILTKPIPTILDVLSQSNAVDLGEIADILLDHENPEIRTRSVEALTNEDPRLKMFQPLLRDNQKLIRDAKQCLELTGESKVLNLSPLVPKLKKDSIFELFKNFSDEGFTTELDLQFSLLAHKDRALRMAAAKLMEEGEYQIVSELIPILNHKYNYGPISAQMLRATSPDLQMDDLLSHVLAEILEPQAKDIAENFIQKYVTNGRAIVRKSNIQSLKSADSMSRKQGAKGLLAHGDSRIDILQPLVELDSDLGSALSDSLLLSTTDEELAKEPLIGLLAHRELAVREATCHILDQLGESRIDMLKPLVSLDSDLGSTLSDSLLLSTTEEEFAKKPLFRLLYHEDLAVRKAAFDVLNRLGDSVVEFFQPLIDLDSNLGSALSVPLLVAPTDEQLLKEPLIRLLAHNELAVREIALNILDQLGESLATRFRFFVQIDPSFASKNAKRLLSTTPDLKQIIESISKIIDRNSTRGNLIGSPVTLADTVAFLDYCLANNGSVTKERLYSLLGDSDCAVRSVAAKFLFLDGEEILRLLYDILSLDMDIGTAVLDADPFCNSIEKLNTAPLVALFGKDSPTQSHYKLLFDSLSDLLDQGAPIDGMSLVAFLGHENQECRKHAALLLEKMNDPRMDQFTIDAITVDSMLWPVLVKINDGESKLEKYPVDDLFDLFENCNHWESSFVFECLKNVFGLTGNIPIDFLIESIGRAQKAERYSYLRLLSMSEEPFIKDSKLLLETLCKMDGAEDFAQTLIKVHKEYHRTGTIKNKHVFLLRFHSDGCISEIASRFFPDHEKYAYAGYKYIINERIKARSPIHESEYLSDTNVKLWTERIQNVEGRENQNAILRRLSRSCNRLAIDAFIRHQHKFSYDKDGTYMDFLLELMDSVCEKLTSNDLYAITKLHASREVEVKVDVDRCDNPVYEPQTEIANLSVPIGRANHMMMMLRHANALLPPLPFEVDSIHQFICRCGLEHEIPEEFCDETLICPACRSHINDTA